ncbi:hypothetical protein D3C78_1662160 [compost metagenome]
MAALTFSILPAWALRIIPMPAGVWCVCSTVSWICALNAARPLIRSVPLLMLVANAGTATGGASGLT